MFILLFYFNTLFFILTIIDIYDAPTFQYESRIHVRHVLLYSYLLMKYLIYKIVVYYHELFE